MNHGILLINLGTPDSPATGDVRKYLREFLLDPRVIDINAVGRWLLVNGIIAPFRAPKSAKLYKEIWTEQGSPLLYYTRRQAELLQAALGTNYRVDFAMRYQSPSIQAVLEKFRQSGVSDITILPLFPQYASATTGSVHEKVMETVGRWQAIPEIRFISSYCDLPEFIDGFVALGRKYDPSKYDHVLFSFHGLPERQIRKADDHGHCLKDNCCAELGPRNANCYRAQCFQTARKIAAGLGLSFEQYTVCFQSRLGKDPWVRPYSDDIIRERAKKGDKRLLVFAPAFTSDCLETIHEIGVEYDELFRELGGEKIQLVESLNESELWVRAMRKLVSRH